MSATEIAELIAQVTTTSLGIEQRIVAARRLCDENAVAPDIRAAIIPSLQTIATGNFPRKLRERATEKLGSIAEGCDDGGVCSSAVNALGVIANETLANQTESEVFARGVAELGSITIGPTVPGPCKGLASKILQGISPRAELTDELRTKAVEKLVVLASLVDVPEYARDSANLFLQRIASNKEVPNAIRRAALASDLETDIFEALQTAARQQAPGDVASPPEAVAPVEIVPPPVEDSQILAEIKDDPMLSEGVRAIARTGLDLIDSTMRDGYLATLHELDTLHEVIRNLERSAARYARVLNRLQITIGKFSQEIARSEISGDARKDAIRALSQILPDRKLPVELRIKAVSGLASVAINPDVPTEARVEASRSLHRILSNRKLPDRVRAKAACKLGRIAATGQHTLPEDIRKGIFKILWDIIEEDTCPIEVRIKAVEGVGSIAIGLFPETARLTAFQGLQHILTEAGFLGGMQTKAVLWLGSVAVGSRTEATREKALEVLKHTGMEEAPLSTLPSLLPLVLPTTRDVVHYLLEELVRMERGKNAASQEPAVRYNWTGEFYKTDDLEFLFAKLYYEKLWRTGRGSPFFQAKILNPILPQLVGGTIGMHLNGEKVRCLRFF